MIKIVIDDFEYLMNYNESIVEQLTGEGYHIISCKVVYETTAETDGDRIYSGTSNHVVHIEMSGEDEMKYRLSK